MISVIETDEFLDQVKHILSEEEEEALVLNLAQRPDAGALIPDTGGLRKLRWAAKGKGKRGGSRVIYYYHNLGVPLVLMAIFAKNVQSDLTQDQRKGLIARLDAIKSQWKERKRK